jgi:hypothetical protein
MRTSSSEARVARAQLPRGAGARLVTQTNARVVAPRIAGASGWESPGAMRSVAEPAAVPWRLEAEPKQTLGHTHTLFSALLAFVRVYGHAIMGSRPTDTSRIVYRLLLIDCAISIWNSTANGLPMDPAD